jgi:hypothetical protein
MNILNAMLHSVAAAVWITLSLHAGITFGSWCMAAAAIVAAPIHIFVAHKSLDNV